MGFILVRIKYICFVMNLYIYVDKCVLCCILRLLVILFFVFLKGFFYKGYWGVYLLNERWNWVLVDRIVKFEDIVKFVFYFDKLVWILKRRWDNFEYNF